MKRSTLFFATSAIVALGFAASVTQAARQPLFSATKATPAGITTDASYRALAQDRATVSLQLIQADAAQITAKSDRLQLGLGAAGTAYLRRATQNPDGTLVWSGTLGTDFGVFDAFKSAFGGEIADDPNNSVIIVRNGDKLTGTIRKNGELYALRPLTSGGHALARIDESRMPADHPAAEYKRMFQQAAFNARLQRKPQAGGNVPGAKANTVVRVLVAYTPAAKAAVGDITGLINLAVAETNQGYANSGVTITMQLAGAAGVTYTESSSFSTDLSRFRGTTDGYMDSIHSTRNSVAADVNVLIIKNSSSCGIGTLNSSASSAFSVVHHSCATGYYSFAHEIGHNMGAHHDPANGSNSYYAYGHGYQSPTRAWRTIMAYNCTTSCPRINYWSNPNRTYGGQPMGTTTRSDNARVLNQRAPTVAAFR